MQNKADIEVLRAFYPLHQPRAIDQREKIDEGPERGRQKGTHNKKTVERELRDEKGPHPDREAARCCRCRAEQPIATRLRACGAAPPGLDARTTPLGV